VLLVPACAGQPSTGARGPEAPKLTESARFLLAEAQQSAVAIPVNPLARDRAKMQQAVGEAWIALGETDQAVACARGIDGWRRAELLTQVARIRADAGDAAGAESLLNEATAVVAGTDHWSHDRVAADVAAVWMRLGKPDRAEAALRPDSVPDRARFENARTALMPAESLDAQADAFDKAIATQAFDLARGGLDGYLTVLSRSGADASRRERAIRALEAGIPGLPVDLQVKYQLDLANVLLDISQPAAARAATDRARTIVREATFLPEDVAPVGAPIAAVLRRQGDEREARALLRDLRSRYDASVARIDDFRRAQALRALGEAWMALGDRPEAATCFVDAIDAGSLNPNARPRAEDLCTTCIAMVRCGFIPDEALAKRIASIRAGLVAPW
jgi:tetratricopeptide (TPR) repeat protein